MKKGFLTDRCDTSNPAEYIIVPNMQYSHYLLDVLSSPTGVWTDVAIEMKKVWNEVIVEQIEVWRIIRNLLDGKYFGVMKTYLLNKTQPKT
jgi:hypothetical protein